MLTISIETAHLLVVSNLEVAMVVNGPEVAETEEIEETEVVKVDRPAT